MAESLLEAFKGWTDEAIEDGVKSGHIGAELADEVHALRYPASEPESPGLFEVPDPDKA